MGSNHKENIVELFYTQMTLSHYVLEFQELKSSSISCIDMEDLEKLINLFLFVLKEATVQNLLKLLMTSLTLFQNMILNI